MPPAARGLPPSGLLSGGNNSPRAPSAPPYPAQACACTGYGGSVGVGHPFSGCRNGAAGKLFFKERRIGMPFPRPAPLTKVLGGRGMGFGEGRGKPFFRKVPSPFPNIYYNRSPSQLKRPGRVAAGIDLGGFSSMRAKKEYPAASSSGRCTVMSKGHAG